jgi:two-component system chemotaxis response regulator CheY
MKILVVDDSGTMRSIEKKILAELGQKEIFEAADGLLALKVVIANKIDLILMDWNMPNLSGIETLKRLKANPATQAIPVIMVTSEAEKSHVMEAVRIGAANYVVKPIVPSVFKEKLAPYLPPMPVVEAPEKPKEEPASQKPAG